MRSQFLDVTDIAPTLLAAAGVAAPKVVNGIEQKSLDGVNALPVLLDGQAKELRTTQYFEVFSNRGIYDHGWFASAVINADAPIPTAALDPDKVTWELYDLDHDFSQAHDLAAQQPARLRQLQDLWWAEAARNDVLPLDWRAGERLMASKRPNPAEGRTSFTYYPGMMALPGAISPRVFNRSWSATAQGTFGPDDAGVLVTEGGLTGGWALYLQGGQVVFEYRTADWSRTTVSPRPCRKVRVVSRPSSRTTARTASRPVMAARSRCWPTESPSRRGDRADAHDDVLRDRRSRRGARPRLAGQPCVRAVVPLHGPTHS